MRRILVCSLLCVMVLLGQSQLGLGELITDFDSKVGPASALTYAQLAGAVFKGVTTDASSGQLKTVAEKILRQPGTKERVTLPEGTPLGPVEVLMIRGDGRRYLVTLWTAEASVGYPGDRAAVLAVFPEGASEPTDVVSVQTDVFCDTGDGKFLSIGPDDAFFIRNSHNNSNQSYLNTGLFHVVDGRLRRIAEVFTFDVRSSCAHSFQETLNWRVEPVSGNPYPSITATVKLSPTDECKTGKVSPKSRVFTESYRYDAAGKRFVSQGKGFGVLDVFNTKNM
jgi:hypothetical protein